ncbi:hypothetical protein AtEden1_Chr3g0201821 [Arabidopsis thaliana]
MEGKGRVGSSSSSSFTAQLFGPKEPSSSANFNSIFPPSKGTARNILSSKHGSLEQRKEAGTCNLSSSLYYGGQDVYSHPTHNHTYPTRQNLLTLQNVESFRLTRIRTEITTMPIRLTPLEETGGKVPYITRSFSKCVSVEEYQVETEQYLIV